MIFYLAGRYEDRDELRDVARQLTAQGHRMACRWLTEDHPQAADNRERAEQACMDLQDITRCDVFVLYSHTRPPLPTRQSHSVELGLALGLQDEATHVCLVGERTENVFHYLPQLDHYPTWAALLRTYKKKGAPHATAST